MALANDGIRPDRQELRIRFFCGALLGPLVGFEWAFHLGSTAGVVTVTVLGSCIGGLLARHLGDRFWGSLRWWV